MRKKHRRKSKFIKFQKKPEQLKTNIIPITITTEKPISPNNKIIYSYEYIGDRKIIKIISVSLQIKIQENWETVLYYDSFHNNKLHRHRRISLDFKGDIPEEKEIKLKGTPADLLSWAIRDINNNYIAYKEKIIKNTKISKNKVDIEFY